MIDESHLQEPKLGFPHKPGPLTAGTPLLLVEGHVVLLTIEDHLHGSFEVLEVCQKKNTAMENKDHPTISHPPKKNIPKARAL